jgi:hypothetical protein
MSVTIMIDDQYATVHRLEWSGPPILRALLQATTADAGCFEGRSDADRAAADDAVLYFQTMGFEASVVTEEDIPWLN